MPHRKKKMLVEVDNDSVRYLTLGDIQEHVRDFKTTVIGF
jgi:hypothetical protein